MQHGDMAERPKISHWYISVSKRTTVLRLSAKCKLHSTTKRASSPLIGFLLASLYQVKEMCKIQLRCNTDRGYVIIKGDFAGGSYANA